MKKIILHSVGDLCAPVFNLLLKRNIIEIPVILTDLAVDFGRHPSFKNTIILPEQLLRKGVLWENNDQSEKLTDFLDIDFREITESVVRHNFIILSQMLNREHQKDSFRTTFEWQNHLIKKLFEITSLIKSVQPSLIFFSEIPHNYGSYLLYAIAKHLNIDTKIVVMPIEVKGRIAIIDSFQDFYYKSVDGFIINNNHSQEQTEIDQKISNLKGEYLSAEPVYVKKYKKKGKTKLLSREFVLKMIARKDNRISLESNKAKRLIKRINNYIWFKKLPGFYNSLTKKPDFNCKFIFFALHYQPEQTSLPMADIFENQFYAIKLLSNCIPAGVKIYVKENPYQFLNMDPHLKNFKTKRFYYDIAIIKNVTLIPMTYSSFDLIDHSLLSATLTGMIGWESINRGKAVLSFGYASYNQCEGVFIVKSEQCIKNAIETVMNKDYIINESKIKNHFKMATNNTFPGVIKRDELDLYNVTYETYMNNLFNNLRHLFG